MNTTLEFAGTTRCEIRAAEVSQLSRGAAWLLVTLDQGTNKKGKIWGGIVCVPVACEFLTDFPNRVIFFLTPVWPIRTRLGPYNCVSSEKQECTGTRVVQKLRQIITKTTTNKQQKTTTTKNDPQIPQPDLRFATKQNSEATRNGAGPKKNQKTHSDLP